VPKRRKAVDCIRIRAPSKKKSPPPKHDDMGGDSIPF
jgi:hypothetical protein